jgi:hypothetical protein
MSVAMVATLIFLLQAATTLCRKSTKSARSGRSRSALALLHSALKNLGLRHGNTPVSGCDLCTRTMFII